jgi:hypothetical protein
MHRANRPTVVAGDPAAGLFDQLTTQSRDNGSGLTADRKPRAMVVSWPSLAQ